MKSEQKFVIEAEFVASQEAELNALLLVLPESPGSIAFIPPVFLGNIRHMRL